MRTKWRFVAVCLGLGLLICFSAEPKEVSGVKTITVDCEKGDSINSALEEKASELIIEITGMCQENVVVERNFVTLRGSDPAVDGIQAESQDDVALFIVKARGINIENLRFTGGDTGLKVDHAVRHGKWAIEIVNCQIEGNSTVGASFYHSDVDAEDTTFSFNGGARDGFGVGVTASRFRCTRCTIQDNAGADGFSEGLNVLYGSRATLRESEISGNETGAILLNGMLSLHSSSSISASRDAVEAHASVVSLSGTPLSGAILSNQGSVVNMIGAVQNANPAANVVQNNSLLNVEAGSTLTGSLDIFNFGKASFSGGSTIDGDLNCDSGGDAYCDDPASVTGTSTCGLCLKP